MPTPGTSLAARPTFPLIAAVAIAASLAGDDPNPDVDDAPDAPAYTDDGKLLRPSDYREWVFVTSGLGMTYGPAKAAEGQEPRFDNVFVTRPAYRAFLESGTWPDGTMFMLEVRSAEANVSINNGGRTQGGVLALEAAVKDRKRFPEGGWGYYSFDGPVESANPLPASASCYACHRDKAAVEHTFVQFYPTLFEVAKRHGTVRPDYEPSRRP
jgi:hypothetical protein